MPDNSLLVFEVSLALSGPALVATLYNLFWTFTTPELAYSGFRLAGRVTSSATLTHPSIPLAFLQPFAFVAWKSLVHHSRSSVVL